MNQNNVRFRVALFVAIIREWWKTISAGFVAVIFAALFLGYQSWNPIVTNVDSHCKFSNWFVSTSKWNTGNVVIECLLENGRLIVLTQSAAWRPPDIGSEMNIGVLQRRFFGESFYLK